MVRRIEVGINTDPQNRPGGNPTPQEMQDLGADWVRFTFKDPSETAQPSAFADYDNLVDKLHSAGIKILMILSYETFPNWPVFRPGADHTQEWREYTPRFVARCRQVAEHYGSRVQAYEIWNEPDHEEGDYNPKVEARFFGPLLEASYLAIKQVSSATVVMGGVASGQPPYVTQVMAATNGLLHADALGVHPYAQRPTEHWPGPTWGGGVMTRLIEEYHKRANKPIWVTEIGINPKEDAPGFQAFQAEYLKRTFEALNQAPAAQMTPCVFWYCWSHAMGKTFGLVGAAGDKRQGYDEFRHFALQVPPAARLRTELLRRGEQEQRIQFNRIAALQRSISKDKFVPNSGEFRVPLAGLTYCGQRAEHLQTGQVRVYYAEEPLWHDVRHVTRPSRTVPERPSAHSSSRDGELVRYIIVHSTNSPVGAPAEDALSLLVGPNAAGRSAHEVVLPGGEVFRLVADGRAAFHLLGDDVRLPDGTSGSAANKATWGVSAYQAMGNAVGRQVLSTTVGRVVAACQRLGLTHDCVRGIGEIDSGSADQPAGVDMDEFRAAVQLGLALLAAGERNLLMPFNPGAAIQQRISADGFVPNSPEFDATVDTVEYVAQRAEHLQSGEVRVYYANKANVSDVKYVTRV